MTLSYSFFLIMSNKKPLLNKGGFFVFNFKRKPIRKKQSLHEKEGYPYWFNKNYRFYLDDVKKNYCVIYIKDLQYVL